MSLVDRNMKNISPDEIVEATEAALALQDTFEYGVEESTRAAAAIQKNFGGSAKEAFSLIAAGAQNGLDYSGELIDTINEYSSQFSKLGFTADGMFQLLQSGADSTAWNLDKWRRHQEFRSGPLTERHHGGGVPSLATTPAT